MYYLLNYNFRVRGAWPVAMVSENRKKVVVDGPICHSSRIEGWILKDLSNDKRLSLSSADVSTKPLKINISGFVFNSSILWDPERWGRPTSLPDTSQILWTAFTVQGMVPLHALVGWMVPTYKIGFNQVFTRSDPGKREQDKGHTCRLLQNHGEKKLGKVIVPDKWKEGASNTTESGGRKINENKLLSKKNRSLCYVWEASTGYKALQAEQCMMIVNANHNLVVIASSIDVEVAECLLMTTRLQWANL
ncbi:hypothetical protein ZIOFF_075853 [Zingiber officinale]|uniref:Glycosyltransferases n=1 Tax=Zingiber officinale TaxID=94328 RepID=A0A8J5C3Z6_ZINOF|nr:hypothetical protein ZIOFF_075853 [Zingiber officinale]